MNSSHRATNTLRLYKKTSTLFNLFLMIIQCLNIYLYPTILWKTKSTMYHLFYKDRNRLVTEALETGPGIWNGFVDQQDVREFGLELDWWFVLMGIGRRSCIVRYRSVFVDAFFAGRSFENAYMNNYSSYIYATPNLYVDVYVNMYTVCTCTEAHSASHTGDQKLYTSFAKISHSVLLKHCLGIICNITRKTHSVQ